MAVRVPPHWLDCSFYVYRSREDAMSGKQSGGSGCFVGVPSLHEGWFHFYALTNRHVIDQGFGVLRVNTFDGKMGTVETQWGDWEILDESGDVAVMPLDLPSQFRRKVVLIEEFISRETMEQFNIWPGDETFLIGRLINQSGQQRNTPVVRFGNISLLPDPGEPIDMGQYGPHEAFLVECRSLSGFSGSPVFLTTSQTFTPKDGKPLRQRKYTGSQIISLNRVDEEAPGGAASGLKINVISMTGTFGPWFLGLDRGHVPLWKPVFERSSSTGLIDQHAETNLRVEHNTGIACVMPAWRIIDILNKEELVKQRKKDDEDLSRENNTATIDDVADIEAPLTQADLDASLKQASRKKL